MKKALLFLPVLTALLAASLFAADPEDKTAKSTVQKVGGLLFDVDEGVKVEQGPGGSVYVRSNRDQMQKKFKEIEDRFQELEARLEKLESALLKEPVPKKAKSEEPETPRVLAA